LCQKNTISRYRADEDSVLTDVIPHDSLRSRLDHEPQELRFGTSGRRGQLVHLTQLEIYINTLAELEYLQSLPPMRGGITRGDEFYFAYDLRPSSTRYVAEVQGRGEIAQAVERAIRDAGMRPVNLGPIPTPALTCYALLRARGSVMITGSHIPFDWNGYKTNSARGELLKEDESPIDERVRLVRHRLYSQRYAEAPFNGRGLFKEGHQQLSPESDEGRSAYLERYAGFFEADSLMGKRLLVYQHSAVGRNLLVEILERLGAEVIAGSRSDEFIPIDTENIDDALVAAIQKLADAVSEKYGPLHGVVSTDGDSDRPMVLGVEPGTGRLKFFGGDLLGMIVAEYLQADAVVVPISCNDAIDRGNLKDRVAPKTRIGSPYVTAGMEKARSRGAKIICGWEANGGFILGSDIERNGRVLKALPTRDAVLPIVCVLHAAQLMETSLVELFARLPGRFSRAALLKQFPRALGRKVVERYSPADKNVRDVLFEEERTILLDEERREIPASELEEAVSIRRQLESIFLLPESGFGRITHLNYTDGVRVIFSNGDVAHIRPSGNADELRIYAVADTQARADSIAMMGIAEPDGILRKMEKDVSSRP
jgi:phosphomannomutase